MSGPMASAPSTSTGFRVRAWTITFATRIARNAHLDSPRAANQPLAPATPRTAQMRQAGEPVVHLAPDAAPQRATESSAGCVGRLVVELMPPTGGVAVSTGEAAEPSRVRTGSVSRGRPAGAGAAG